MAERCPLEIEGGVVAADGFIWDGDIPVECQRCMGQTDCHTVLQEQSYDLDDRWGPVDMDNVDRFVCIGLRLAADGLRIGKEEVGIDPGALGDDYGALTYTKVIAFDCPRVSIAM